MRVALRQPYKQFLGTLANQVRIDIINELQRGPKNVSAIVTALDYDQSTVSHSLTRLTHCGFVTAEQRGKERIYTLNTKTIKPLLALMEQHMETYCKHIVGGECQ